MGKSVIQLVNEKIIEKLENGVNPWRKTWVTSGGIRTNEPRNYITNKAYSGINFVLLDPGYYLTFKQCNELGGTIKKGAKGNLIVYSAPYEKETDDEIKKGFVLKYYYVFRLEDCENIKEIKTRPIENVDYNETIMTDAAIDAIIEDYAKRTNLTLKNIEQDRAYYNHNRDTVVLPLTKQFENISEYYATAFHELGHSTGHHTRLNREGINGMNYFGSDKYSKEELIAEITSAYCMNYCGIETNATLENSAAYLKAWANHLKGNTANYFIMNATTHAEKAFKLIMNIK
jgi:antirestriction protein ArdC